MTGLCVAVLIAHTGFQPVEYGETVKALKKAGIGVRTLSNKPGIATASATVPGYESQVKIDGVIDGYDIQACRGFIIIGGPGTLENLDTPKVHEKLKKIKDAGIAYGAICIAPRILLKAGVLKGIQMTGWDGDGELSGLAQAGGAFYKASQPVVRDSNIVTASGPQAAKKFGEAVVELFLTPDFFM